MCVQLLACCHPSMRPNLRYTRTAVFYAEGHQQSITGTATYQSPVVLARVCSLSCATIVSADPRPPTLSILAHQPFAALLPLRLHLALHLPIAHSCVPASCLYLDPATQVSAASPPLPCVFTNPLCATYASASASDHSPAPASSLCLGRATLASAAPSHSLPCPPTSRGSLKRLSPTLSSAQIRAGGLGQTLGHMYGS